MIAHEHDLIYPPTAGRAAAAAMPQGRFTEILGLAHGEAIDAAARVMQESVEFFRAAAPGA